MHTTQTKNLTIHHNGDYSGDVIIQVKPEQVQHIAANTKFHIPAYAEVTIDFKDLRTFVFGYLRDKMISELEQMSDEDLEESFVAV